jgi:hypothetical protein
VVLVVVASILALPERERLIKALTAAQIVAVMPAAVAVARPQLVVLHPVRLVAQVALVSLQASRGQASLGLGVAVAAVQ